MRSRLIIAFLSRLRRPTRNHFDQAELEVGILRSCQSLTSAWTWIKSYPCALKDIFLSIGGKHTLHLHRENQALSTPGPTSLLGCFLFALTNTHTCAQEHVPNRVITTDHSLSMTRSTSSTRKRNSARGGRSHKVP